MPNGPSQDETARTVPRTALPGLGDLRSGIGFDLPKVAGLVFMAADAVMVLGGIALVFDDPGGFALIAFGAIFMAVGYLARRFFSIPAGQRAMVVESQSTSRNAFGGGRHHHTSATITPVNEDADEREVETARPDWRRAGWKDREDWAAGRIGAEEAKAGTLLFWAAGLWFLFAIIMTLAAALWETFLWLVAALAGAAALGMLGYGTLIALRRRKFGDSVLVLDQTPAILGQALTGRLHCGIAQTTMPRDGFLLKLVCAQRWEERVHSSARNGGSQTRRLRKTLWEREERVGGAAAPGSPDLQIPVRLDLPADRPESTLGNTAGGIVWELEVSARMAGLDYKSQFSGAGADAWYHRHGRRG